VPAARFFIACCLRISVFLDLPPTILSLWGTNKSRHHLTWNTCCLKLRQVSPTCKVGLTVALVNQWLDYGNSTLVGITTYLVRRMQSALNAVARLIFNLRHSNHITDALVSLHWLRVSEQIDYKIAVLTYRVLHGGTPRYLRPLTSVVDLRRALRSAVTNRLVSPSVRLSTVGSRAFPVAAPRIWNFLPEHVVTAETHQSFKKHLKTFLLQRSYSLAL